MVALELNDLNLLRVWNDIKNRSANTAESLSQIDFCDNQIFLLQLLTVIPDLVN